MDTLDRAAQLDNVMFVTWPLTCRQDVARAFEGSGIYLDPSCRIRYIDNGALATFWAGNDDDYQRWMAINWSAFSETDRNTWLVHWSKLPQKAH